MKLHKLRDNWYALKEFDHEALYSIAYKFDFGLMPIEVLPGATVADAKISSECYGEKSLDRYRNVIDAAEAMYTFLYETGRVEDNLNMLAEEVMPIGYDIFFEHRITCSKVSDKTTRVFKQSGKSFRFDLEQDGERLQFRLGNTMKLMDGNNGNTALRIIRVFCSDKLFEIYKEDRSRTHLAKYQDRYFAADLGF